MYTLVDVISWYPLGLEVVATAPRSHPHPKLCQELVRGLATQNPVLLPECRSRGLSPLERLESRSIVVAPVFPPSVVCISLSDSPFSGNYSTYHPCTDCCLLLSSLRCQLDRTSSGGIAPSPCPPGVVQLEIVLRVPHAPRIHVWPF